MSKLLELIDDYKDRHGQPSDRSIARAVGIAPQTLSAWRHRGLRELPAAETLRQLAAFIGVSDDVTFYAAGVDAGYIIEHYDDGTTSEDLDLASGLESGQIAARFKGK